MADFENKSKEEKDDKDEGGDGDDNAPAPVIDDMISRCRRKNKMFILGRRIHRNIYPCCSIRDCRS